MPQATRLTPALTRAIARSVRSGKTLGEAAKASGVGRSTAMAWMRRGALTFDAVPEVALDAYGAFCRSVRQASAAHAGTLLAKINRLIRAERPTAAMEAAALDARRVLERRFPDLWGAARANAAHALRVTLVTFQLRAHTPDRSPQMPPGAGD